MQPDSIFLQRTPQAHFAKQTIISVGQYENSLYLVCNAEKHACGKSELWFTKCSSRTEWERKQLLASRIG